MTLRSTLVGFIRSLSLRSSHDRGKPSPWEDALFASVAERVGAVHPDSLDALVATLAVKAKEVGEQGNVDTAALYRRAGDAVMALRRDIPWTIADPDYARAFSIIRCKAWQYGFAAMPHGSFTRDLDVCLVPWKTGGLTRRDGHTQMFAVITEALETSWRPQGDSPAEKEHGRLALSYVSRLDFGDPRWLDVSLFPGRPIDLA